MATSELFSGLHAWFLFLTSSWRSRALKRLRHAWGKEGDKDRWLVSWLFELTRNARDDVVDEATWSDLELDRVFTSVDTTISRVGSQYLYRKFRTFAADPSQLGAEYSTYRALREDAATREQIQLCLLGLQSDTDAFICSRLFGPEPAKLRFAPLIFLASAASLSSRDLP